MSETWLQEYVFLALRLNRASETAYETPFAENYWGPAAWQEQVEDEPEPIPADLVNRARMLIDTLPTQGFTSNRTNYLAKALRAMETLARKLSGETFTLTELARNCFDLSPVWTPEEQFEQAYALYESVVPAGTDSLAERLQTYRSMFEFPQEPSHVLQGAIEEAFAEARRRTLAFLTLPEAESIEMQYFPEKGYAAAARYQGNYRTRVEMNLQETAVWFPRLFDHKVCHEGYPGHHADFVLRDQYLARQHGYAEQTMYLTIAPQCVISEGIAMVAHEMIFSEGEAEQWIADQMARLLHQTVDAQALLRLRQASDMLQGVWSNAAILLDEGHTEAEVARYFSRYMLTTEEKAPAFVEHLKDPIYGSHTAFVYGHGQKLVKRWLQGTDRAAVFYRFLTEQWTPSQLAGESLPLPQ